jgi:hypothetical protein
MALDLTKPVANSKGASAEMRANFTALARALGHVSLVRDGGFRVWAESDSAAPSHYTTVGTVPTIARVGTITGTLDASTDTDTAYESGIESTAKVGDIFRNTTRSKTRLVTAVGTNYVDLDSAITSQASGDTFYLIPCLYPHNALKLTRGASAGGVKQIVLNATDALEWLGRFRGGYVSIGCAVHALVGSNARLAIYDGVDTTYSDYHTNVAGWEWLEVVHPFDDDWNTLEFHMLVEASSSAACFSGLTGLLGDAAPQGYIPGRVQPGLIQFTYPGTPVVDSGSPNGYQRVTLGWPAWISGVSASMSDPTDSTAMTVDLYKYESAAWASILSSAMSIGTSGVPSSHPAFSSYNKQCLDGRIALDTPAAAYSEIGSKITGAGSGTLSDLRVLIHTLQYFGALDGHQRLGSFGRQ